jgi:hypothetical protein
MKTPTLIVTTLLASALLALPVAAEPQNDGARKWSQPDYDTDDGSLENAPALDAFPTIPENNDAALLDGDRRLIDGRPAGD